MMALEGGAATIPSITDWVLSLMHRTLLAAGASLILIGLVMGFDLSLFGDPETALAAHVAALQHGTILMVVGVAWRYSRLGGLEAACGWANILGLVGIWLSLMVDAVWSDDLLPLGTFNGYLFMLTAWSLVAGFGLFLWGLLAAGKPSQ